MMKRVVGISLIGVGLYLLVVSFALAFFVAPYLAQLPYDMGTRYITTEAKDASVAKASFAGGKLSIEVVQADLRIDTTIEPDGAASAALTDELADHAVVWNVFHQVKYAESGELVSDGNTRIALDRSTGAAVDWSGQCQVDEPNESCVAGSAAYAGQLYQFPFGTKKKTYQYWDSELRKALPMHYAGTDTIAGMQAYRFEHTIDEQPLDPSQATLGMLLGRFAPGATTGEMMYDNHRTVWVEPVTGAIVSLRDEPRRTLVPDVGPRTVLFDATITYDKATADEIAADARGGRFTILAVRRYVPLGLLLAGILALVFGYRALRQTRTVASDRAQADRAPISV